MRICLLIIFLFTVFQILAQNVEHPLLKSRVEEYELKPGKNFINIEFFYNDSVWLTYESNDFFIHSYVINIQKSKSYSERFFAHKGVLKGASIKSIIYTFLPFEIKISEIKIAFNNEFIILPVDYILVVR